MERIKRRIELEADTAKNAGRPHPYDEAKPWNFIWRLAAEDALFWRREVEEPCLLVLSRSSSLSEMVQPDNPLGTAAPLTSNAASSHSSSKRQASASVQSPKKKQNFERVHNIDASGSTFTTNRRGIALCPGWQAATCLEVRNEKCAVNQNMVHQCSKCLSRDHGAKDCSRKPHALSPRPAASSRGKGKKGKW